MAEDKQKTINLLTEEVDLEQRKLDLLREQKKVDAELFRQRQTQVNERELDLIKKRLDATHEMMTIEKKIADIIGGKIVVSQEEYNDLLNRAREIQKEKLEFDEKELEWAKKRVAKLEAQNEQMRKQQEAVENIEARTQNLISLTLGVSDNWKEGAIGAILQAKEAGNLNEVLDKMANTINNTITPGNVLASTLSKVKEATFVLTYAMDESQARFVQQTGASRDTMDNFQQLALENRFLGMNMENTTEAATALINKFHEFNSLSSASQDLIVKNTALLTNLGISAESTAGLYADLNKIYGMSANDTEKLTRELLDLRGSGLSAKDAVEGFSDNLNVLARYTGPQAIQVYKQLASQSKALQIATQNLLGIASQFDTFESAATSVGKLNALLGGDYLNSVDMLNASEAERIKMLNESIHLSGKSWDSLNKYEKMAIANTVGISDMNEAAKIFGTSMMDLDRQMLADKGALKAQEEFEAMMRDAQSLQDDIISLGQSFALSSKWIIDGLKGAIDIVKEGDEWFREMTNNISGGNGSIGLLPIVTALGTYLGGKFSFAVLKGIAGIPMMTANLGALSTSMVTTATTSAPAATGIAAVSTAGKGGAAGGAGLMKLSVGLLAAGAAGLMLGEGLHAAGQGGAVFFDSFSKIDTEQTHNLMKLMGMFMLMGPTVPLLALSATGFAALGAGLYAFGEGLSNVSGLENFVGLLEQINKLESSKVVQFEQISKTIRKTINETRNAGSSASVLKNYSETISAPTASTSEAGKTHKIVLVSEDQFGNERMLKELIIDVVNNELNIRKNN